MATTFTEGSLYGTVGGSRHGDQYQMVPPPPDLGTRRLVSSILLFNPTAAAKTITLFRGANLNTPQSEQYTIAVVQLAANQQYLLQRTFVIQNYTDYDGYDHVEYINGTDSSGTSQVTFDVAYADVMSTN